MALFDSVLGDSLESFRTQLGLTPRYRAPQRELLSGVGATNQRIFRDTLQDALFTLYLTGLREERPDLARALATQFGPIRQLYQAATARDDELEFDRFLEQFDPERYRSRLSPFERGERPALYTRGYRLLYG